MSLKALLFDLDGTIIDSDSLHEAAWIEALQQRGIAADHQYYQTMVSGGTNEAILQRIFPDMPADERLLFAQHKEAEFRLAASNIAVVEGFWPLWQWCKQQGLATALVTNAPELNARMMLDKFNLEFDVVILGEHCSSAKPSPVPYQEALRVLGVTAKEAIAFEDSPSGVRAAVGAGVATIGLTTGHSAQALMEAGCYWASPDFGAVLPHVCSIELGANPKSGLEIKR